MRPCPSSWYLVLIMSYGLKVYASSFHLVAKHVFLLLKRTYSYSGNEVLPYCTYLCNVSIKRFKSVKL